MRDLPFGGLPSGGGSAFGVGGVCPLHQGRPPRRDTANQLLAPIPQECNLNLLYFCSRSTLVSVVPLYLRQMMVGCP